MRCYYYWLVVALCAFGSSVTCTAATRTAGCHDSLRANKAQCEHKWREQLPPLDASGAFQARVRWVHDGDTLQVSVGDGGIDIRIGQIDAPEREQAYGWTATLVLIDLVRDRDVRIQPVDVDRYGRIVARVFAGRTDVGRELLLRGAAWCYTRRSKSADVCAPEREARQAGRGLWALAKEQRIPPWEWRRQHRAT